VIEVLVETDLAELKAEPKIIEAIDAFRKGLVVVVPGGGGKYGEVRLPGGAAAAEEKQPVPTRSAPEKKQKSLFDF